ncbi:MAG: flagellar hook-basal body complex protein FliE [Ruminiclostridium sp.]|nr:flagellar hook-basal body complex protein FliE [Ruminiclostridium sp.]
MIIPMSPVINTLPSVDRLVASRQPSAAPEAAEGGLQTGTFLDALTGLWDQAYEAQAQKSEDMMNIMLGDTDGLEQIQMNIAKAELSTELLVNIKNAVVDAYNEIMRMSI